MIPDKISCLVNLASTVLVCGVFTVISKSNSTRKMYLIDMLYGNTINACNIISKLGRTATNTNKLH